MAHIVFDLSSSESRSRFRELAADMLDLLEGSMTEGLLAKFKGKARSLDLAAPDYHAILLEVLHASGGKGFTISDAGICCPACSTIQKQATWLCIACGRQMVVDTAMQMEQIRTSGVAVRFVEDNHANWNHSQWLSFQRSIRERFGLIPEALIGALLEDVRRHYLLQREGALLEQNRNEFATECSRLAEERTKLERERKAFSDEITKEKENWRREAKRNMTEEFARLEQQRQGLEAESRRLADERTRLERERRSFEERKQDELSNWKREQKEREQTQWNDDETAKHLTLMFDMVSVAGGSFKKSESIYHVDISHDFKICRHPVTQSQWIAVMGRNPSHFLHGVMHPVENVSYNDVQQFITRLNQVTGRNYRLPTEAEWEYAARSGGRNEKWAGTSNEQKMEEYCWNVYNSGGGTKPVGLKKPNGLGIYDMSGNVWEWCHGLALRGGSWSNGTEFVTVASRRKGKRTEQGSFIGFRLVLSA